jgi:hypothetical protein
MEPWRFTNARRVSTPLWASQSGGALAGDSAAGCPGAGIGPEAIPRTERDLLLVLREELGGDPPPPETTEEARAGILAKLPAIIRQLYAFLHGLPVQPLFGPRRVQKVGRNEPCPCGSGRKFKKCCDAIAPG